MVIFMSNFTLNMQKLMLLYESSKRTKNTNPTFGYDIDKEDFIKITDSVLEKMKSGKINVIPFINSYELCLKIIDEYLSQPAMDKYREGAYKSMRERKHEKVVAFLWYFEHIDGTYPFGVYERKKVFKTISKWAQINGFGLEITEDKSELL